MNNRKIRTIAIFVLLSVIVLTLTGCKAKGYSTEYAKDKASATDKYNDAVDWVELEIVGAKVEVEVKKAEAETELVVNELNKKIDAETDEAQKQLFENEKTTAQADLIVKKEELNSLKNKAYEMVKNKSTDYSETVAKINALASDEASVLAVKEKVKAIIQSYADYDFISNVETQPVLETDSEETKEEKQANIDKQNKNFKVNLIKADVERYLAAIDAATSFDMLSTGLALKDADGNNVTLDEAATIKENRRNQFEKALEVKQGCALLGGGMTASKAATDLSKESAANSSTNVYELLAYFVIDVEIRLLEQEPLHFTLTSFGEFFTNFFNNFLVFPVGWLLYAISKLFGGWYIIGMFITTIIVRTLGWPIYAKTNDMSLKMQVIQPEIQKLEEKYANRKDPDSQRMKQAEQQQIYKKNKIGFGGCLMPFLQFPIFMSVYYAIRRLPYTVAVSGSRFTLDWANELKSSFFGLPLDLFEDYTAGTAQLIGIIVLVILVSGTQFLSQKFSEKRQKENQQKSQEDIPEYRRQAYKQTQGNTQNTMKYVMYMMIFMMATFVFTSKAGLGIYWLIGNLYSMIQTIINNKLSLRKMEKMKEKSQLQAKKK